MKYLFNLQNALTRILMGVGGLSLIAIMLLTVVDVGGRFFKYPLFGTVELVGFLAVISVAAALPHTYKVDGHVGVELFLRLLPLRVRLWIELFTRILSLGLFTVISWQMFLYAADLKQSGEVSMNLEFPVHYIVFLLALGLLIFSVTIVQRIVATLTLIKTKE
ncbi:MAG: C4-dicarboxylate ABC transporter permease [Desulfobacterales bacterium]|nr:MAG: C4-dicarboxylate ABC transporter permease [Desulfobacterales bacterium]